MRPEQFAELGLEFHGYGMINKLVLDREFFTEREKEAGSAILDVLRVNNSVGGNYLNGALGGGLDGCLIEFENGTFMTVTYNGEYIDVAVYSRAYSKEK